jgi:hypothetical protein
VFLFALEFLPKSKSNLIVMFQLRVRIFERVKNARFVHKYFKALYTHTQLVQGHHLIYFEFSNFLCTYAQDFLFLNSFYCVYLSTYFCNYNNNNSAFHACMHKYLILYTRYMYYKKKTRKLHKISTHTL